MASTATAEIKSTAKAGKYLTFALDREEYGIEILKAREIIGYMDITAIPRTPPHVRGVINLRGQVISVIDLRSKFGMDRVERTEQTCIIVVETSVGGRKRSTGVIVDKVSEVLNIAPETIEEPPEFGGAVNTAFILGMAKVNGGVKILLDLDKALDEGDLASSTEQTEQAA